MKNNDCYCGGWPSCTVCGGAGVLPESSLRQLTTTEKGLLGLPSRSERVRIFPSAKIIVDENSFTIGHDVIIDDNVWMILGVGSSIGSYTHIAVAASVQGNGRFVMGDFCSVAAGARLYTAGDDLKGGALVNPCVPTKYRNAYRAPLIMEKHSIVATNAVVMAGTIIGEGAVVGACSYVKPKSVLEAWAIYAGAPARKIGERNRDEVLRREKEFLAEVGS